ncbi:MAG: WbqC family protein [Bacteroidales bacterium]|nr:WbqC family protein [Bacteroidales bacterium]
MADTQNTILLSTAYLPPIEYFNYLLNSDNQIIEKHETYKKQTYRNRCYILSSNGKQALTIPINKQYGNHTKINEITISYTENWQQIHWRSIESAYNSSPFFLFYKDKFEEFYQKKHKYLFDHNNDCLKLIFNFLDIEISPDFTSEFIKNPKNILDFRNSISPKTPFQTKQYKIYSQVFAEKNGFTPNLSLIDLLFNTGPEAIDYLSLNVCQ